jgi:hypothetical protein
MKRPGMTSAILSKLDKKPAEGDKAEGAEGDKSETKYDQDKVDAMDSAASDLVAAVKKGDSKAVSAALRDFYAICDE